MITFDENKILMDKIHICFHKDHKKQYEMKMNGYENDLILSMTQSTTILIISYVHDFIISGAYMVQERSNKKPEDSICSGR